jgi:hypothetical protein
MNTASSYDLFISYAEADQVWVEDHLVPALGIAPERLITERTFCPGALVIDEFERVVTSSRYTVLVLSPAYLRDSGRYSSLSPHSRAMRLREIVAKRAENCGEDESENPARLGRAPGEEDIGSILLLSGSQKLFYPAKHSDRQNNGFLVFFLSHWLHRSRIPRRHSVIGQACR